MSLGYGVRGGSLPASPARVHFVGIGGVGMSGLARILHAWGYGVSGSDAVASEQTAALISEGIPVTIGHADTERAGAADLVVVTAAVRGDNAEVRAATAAGVRVVKRAELLGLLANERSGVAVAGTHGKSTTSGMLVTALRALRAEPSYAVGATVAATGTNAAPGDGDVMVVEADEYDHSFLWLTPEVAIITNLEYDHPDVFPDQAAYDSAFARFAANVRPGGTLVIAGDDPGCARLLSSAALAQDVQVVTFGQTDNVAWLLAGSDGSWQVTPPSGGVLPLRLTVPGLHNARNATAALAALVALGHDAGEAAAELAAFTGVGRRFEVKGEAGGVTVVDDYAHHPSEIRVTLRAARDRYPNRRLWAVFQPHTYSRTKALLMEFAESFTDADRIMVLEIYPSRETDTLGISSADLCARIRGNVLAAADPSQAADCLAKQVAPGDVVVTLGAGDITAVGPRLIEALSTPKEPRPRRRVRHVPKEDTSDQYAIPDRPSLKILANAPMSRYTTWRIGGPADLLVRAPTTEDLIAAVRWGHEQGMPVTVIGGGSNLLVGDGGIRGLVVVVRTPGERAEALVQAEDGGDYVEMRVGAQAPLSWVGRYASERGWAGMDWGVGLPGQIGGATVNNAGAHGTELKDHLKRVVVLNDSGDLEELPAEWLEASYRHTRIKASRHPRVYTVLESVFHLPKADPAELIPLADEHAQFRKETQPTGACSGSTFANPPGDFAGRLLEAAGLKGYRHGAAQFSPKHGNWIVNTGGASARDVRELIAHAREVIRDRFGVVLRPEIEEIGEP